MGDEYGLPRNAEDLSFFGNEQDGIVNFSIKGDNLYVSRFDPKTLTLAYNKQIELSGATRNMNSEMIIGLDNRYYWLQSDWNKQNEKEILYVNQVDVKSGKLSGAETTLIETNRMAGYLAPNGIYSAKKVGKYTVNYNADKSKVLITYTLVPDVKRDAKSHQKIGVHVFNNKMEKLWGQEFTMPYTEKLMNSVDYALDKEGNAFLLARIFDSESRKRHNKETGLPGNHLEVFKFSSNNEQAVQASVTLGESYIIKPVLIESPTGEMLIASTYSNKKKGDGIAGVFLGVVGNDGTIQNYKNGKYDFPKDELQKFEGARTRRAIDKDNYEPENLVVRDVVVEHDGSVLISLEEYYIKQTMSTSTTPGFKSSTQYRTEYFYNDILAVKMGSSGNFGWLRKIPKLQKGNSGRGTMSFKLITDASGYYFLYVDNKANLNLRDEQKPKAHVDGLGGQVVVAKIDNVGKVTKEIVFDTREEDVKIYPADFTKINNSQFIGRARIKKKLYQPLLITVH